MSPLRHTDAVMTLTTIKPIGNRLPGGRYPSGPGELSITGGCWEYYSNHGETKPRAEGWRAARSPDQEGGSGEFLTLYLHRIFNWKGSFLSFVPSEHTKPEYGNQCN